MSVPAYSDIAKASNDLLSKDFYHLAQANLEVKTQAPNGVAFTAKGKSAQDSGKISGNLESKYTDKGLGLTVTQGWTTANEISTKLEVNDVFTPGLKTEISNSALPVAKDIKTKLGLTFSQPSIFARANLDVFSGPKFTGDVTVGHNGFLAGGEFGYDIGKGSLSKYSAALGYAAPIYTIALTGTENLSVFSASYYHRVQAVTEVGAKATWSKLVTSDVQVEFGAKHRLDASSFAKAKVNSQGVATLAYSQVLRPGVTLGLGMSVDTQRLNEPLHKFGWSLSFAA